MKCWSAPLLQCASKGPPLVVGSLTVISMFSDGYDMVVGALMGEVVFVRRAHDLPWPEVLIS